MAKPRSRPTAPLPDPSPFHSAFAGLASLRDQLPEGSAVADATAEAATTDESVLPNKLVVRRERKGRKGKTVTRVAGFGADRADWARRMKQELGCGGSLEGDDVILAGDLVDRVLPWLEAAGIRRVVRGS